jgi:rod shape-determining protein MreC
MNTIYRRIHDMKIRSTTSLAASIKPRPIMQMTGLCALVVIGLALMFLHHGENPAVQRIRGTVQMVFSPVIDFLSQPAMVMQRIGENAHDLTAVYTENTALRAENAQLLEWQAVAKRLELENRELRGLLGISAADDAQYVSARIISTTHDPFSHTLMISHDGDARIRPGLPVIAAEGLVGRVLETNGKTARVLLITDRQSRIPVQQETNGEHGILTGDNVLQAIALNHVERPKLFKEGDRIITSKSQLFPVHFVVGEVVRNHKGEIAIRPYADSRKLRFVSIVIPDSDSDFPHP